MDFLIQLQAIVGLFSLAIFYHLWVTWAHNSKWPIEPTGHWPILGHLYLLSGPEPLHQKLGAMADKYGPAFMLQLGMRRMLVVNSWEVAKECFTINDKALSSRPTSSAARYMGYNYAMFGFAPYGPYWREIRKIATLQLLSNSQLELLKQVRATEIDVRIKELHRLWVKNDGSSAKVDLKKWCGDMTLNVVLKMVVGKQYCFDDFGNFDGHDEGESEGRRFREAITRFFYLLGVSVVSDVLPFVEWLDLHGHKRTMRRTAKELDSMLVSWLEEHRRRRFSGDNNDNQDFMDVMLSIMEGAQFSSYDPDTIIKATCMTLILGGTDTTSVSLAGALSYVASNRHVLKKAQDELDMHVGKDRNVDESDIKNLVYLQAIIKETLRMCPASPISVPREVMKDCQIAGCHVSAGTRVLVNIWKIQQDPRVWSDPSEFRPERFLTSQADLDVRGQHFEYIPFGSGRRSCPGISFALQVMHLALARVLHGFHLGVASDGPIDVMKSLSLSETKSTSVEVLVAPRLSPKLYE